MTKYLSAFALMLGLLGMHVSSASANSPERSDEIRVVGLFKNAAIISINQQRAMIRVGDQKHDVRLLAANSDKAVIEYHGQRLELSMSDGAGIRIGLPTNNAQAMLMSSGNMFNVTGSINGQLADFVVDTGASYITMSQQQAAQLRLDYSNAQQITVGTANGKTTAAVFNVEKIRIGSIELNNVQAAVVDNLASSRILLGMSFLSQVEMQHKDGLMILRKRS